MDRVGRAEGLTLSISLRAAASGICIGALVAELHHTNTTLTASTILFCCLISGKFTGVKRNANLTPQVPSVTRRRSPSVI
jgi:hypothetical protein